MSYSNIPAGKDAPNDIYVIIEIPANAAPIKYEIDKDSDALFVDRFMGTAMFYPANYGYVPNTLSEDGDPLDVLVVTPHPVEPGSVIRCRPVGKLNMEDDGGIDAKLIAVPHDKLTCHVELRSISHRYHRHLPCSIYPQDGNELLSLVQLDVALQQVHLMDHHLQTRCLVHNHSSLGRTLLYP